MRVLPRHQMTSGVLHDFLSAIRGAARNDRRRVQHTFFRRGMTTQELLMEGVSINNRESDYRRGRRRMLFGGRRRWRCLCGGGSLAWLLRGPEQMEMCPVLNVILFSIGFADAE